MLSHFNMCLWDPYTFSLYNSELIKKIPKASRLVQEGFLFGMRKMAKLVYFMPGAKDHYFNMAFFCHILEDYEFAADLYKKSLKSSHQDSQPTSQADRQADSQPASQADSQTASQTARQPDRQAGRQT